MLILPVVLGTLLLTFKLDQKMHGLYFLLVLQMSAPGLMSSPALAALLVHSGHQVYRACILARTCLDRRTAIVFKRAGRARKFAIGLIAGNRAAPSLPPSFASQRVADLSLTSRCICVAAALPV
jgi:hypothetical protein